MVIQSIRLDRKSDKFFSVYGTKPLHHAYMIISDICIIFTLQIIYLSALDCTSHVFYHDSLGWFYREMPMATLSKNPYLSYLLVRKDEGCEAG